jgi:hypothetical protein
MQRHFLHAMQFLQLVPHTPTVHKNAKHTRADAHGKHNMMLLPNDTII